MNGSIRAELTQLLADHLVEKHVARVIANVGYPTSRSMWEIVANDAMDFIYGGEDDSVPQPERQEVQKADSTSGAPRVGCGTDCGCLGDGGDSPGNVDRLEGGPVTSETVLGVVTPVGPDAFVYLGRPSPTGEYVRLPRSNFGPYSRSAPEPDSADD